jgi:iron(III) transport system permease protein
VTFTREEVNSQVQGGAGLLVRRPRVGGRIRVAGTFTLTAIVIALILVPIGILLVTSFLSEPLGSKGVFTFGNYPQAVTQPGTAKLVENTLIYTLGASAVAIAIGSFLAWAATFAAMPGRRVLRLLPLAVLFLPALLTNPAWIELYSPTTGLISVGLPHVLGINRPLFNIFSMPGMIFTFGFSMAPLPYLILLAPFGAVGRSLMEASEVSGAGWIRTQTRVLLPILTPGLLSAALVSAIVVLSSFETPLFIGLPAGITTFTSELYQEMNSPSADFNVSSAQAVLYLLITGVLLVLYLRATRNEQRFVSVTGRSGGGPALISGWKAGILSALVGAYFVVAFVLPVVITALVSLLPYYTLTNGSLPPLTLANFRAIANSYTVNAMTDSLEVAVITAVLSVTCALILGWIALKTRFAGRRLIELVGTYPIGIPAVVFSIALLMTFLSVPGLKSIYSSPLPLMLAQLIVCLPFALRIISSSVIQLHDEMVEASTTSGAGWGRTIRLVILPLLRRSILYAGLATFILAFREFGAVVLLVTANFTLLPTLTYSLWFDARSGPVSALNMLAFFTPIVVLLIGALAAWLLGKAGRMVRRGRADVAAEVLGS